MRNFFLLLATAAICLTGCGSDDDGFVFAGNNNNAVAPAPAVTRVV